MKIRDERAWWERRNEKGEGRRQFGRVLYCRKFQTVDRCRFGRRLMYGRRREKKSVWKILHLGFFGFEREKMNKEAGMQLGKKKVGFKF